MNPVLELGFYQTLSPPPLSPPHCYHQHTHPPRDLSSTPLTPLSLPHSYNLASISPFLSRTCPLDVWLHRGQEAACSPCWRFARSVTQDGHHRPAEDSVSSRTENWVFVPKQPRRSHYCLTAIPGRIRWGYVPQERSTRLLPIGAASEAAPCSARRRSQSCRPLSVAEHSLAVLPPHGEDSNCGMGPWSS